MVSLLVCMDGELVGILGWYVWIFSWSWDGFYEWLAGGMIGCLAACYTVRYEWVVSRLVCMSG